MDLIKKLITLSVDHLKSLQLQNHLYGCFVLMEDIAENKVVVSDTIISNSEGIIIDFDKDFNKIGTVYGFITDNKIVYNENGEYKQFWLDMFKSIDLSQDITEVDAIEDAIFQVIKTEIPVQYNFFSNALITGTLSDEYTKKVHDIVNDISLESAVLQEQNKVDEITSGGGIYEKKQSVKIHKIFRTRRARARRATPKRRYYNKTRKCVKNY